MIIMTSSVSPRRTSASKTTASASLAPDQAPSTIASSKRRFGLKMPGVSTKMIWLAPEMTIARNLERVVWTLCDTIEILVPASALTSVDLPAFGAPMIAQKPQRVCLPVTF